MCFSMRSNTLWAIIVAESTVFKTLMWQQQISLFSYTRESLKPGDCKCTSFLMEQWRRWDLTLTRSVNQFSQFQQTPTPAHAVLQHTDKHTAISLSHSPIITAASTTVSFFKTLSNISLASGTTMKVIKKPAYFNGTFSAF